MHVRILVALSAALTLMLFVGAWFFVQNNPKEKPEQPRHPVGAIYNITGNAAENKQITVYFDGFGKARLIDGEKEVKKVLDFVAGTVTIADFKTQQVTTTNLDPMRYPIAIDRDGAKKAGAKLRGEGNERAFPYEKWKLTIGSTDTELWTDNHDRFPVFYGAANGAMDLKWTLVNSWIDGAVVARPNFFVGDLTPDIPTETATGTATGTSTESASAGGDVGVAGDEGGEKAEDTDAAKDAVKPVASLKKESPVDDKNTSLKKESPIKDPAAEKPTTQLKPTPNNLRHAR